MKITKEYVHEMITKYHLEAGESFYDGAFAIRSEFFLTWCYGKGYLTYEKYNRFCDDWTKRKLEAIDENYFVYNSEGEYGASYAVVVEDEWTDEGQEKANLILGEWIESSEHYQRRFKKFVEDNDLAVL